ncbi:hypothetical protein KSF_087660 [Reticulibacter mediterranei]|uniref:YCII-related domain-containing protein n=1 Tax=Reticulibacter mediterranei TaxID=2778369 RepID=A0A8J3IR41_9CHLR|nr:YciI family protein [Reticulibacter mediterranei]GHO98718.1 hypothetical protein KSF_087660 [Reticulibacter mediterranei]
MKYLLLFCANQEELAAWQAFSEEERIQSRAKTRQWMQEHGPSQVRWIYGLHLPHTVTSVHADAKGKPLVTDGPFLEGTEVIGGVAEIEVANLDEALQFARAWAVAHAPDHPVIEIWPIVEE